MAEQPYDKLLRVIDMKGKNHNQQPIIVHSTDDEEKEEESTTEYIDRTRNTTKSDRINTKIQQSMSQSNVHVNPR